MDAIVLLGGEGRRLRSVVNKVPKPLAPIRSRPFADYLLDQITPYVSQIILAVGYLREQIIERYADRGYLFSEESVPLGTGGAACQAAELARSEHVWVINGDSFFAIDFQAMEKEHVEKGADVTLAARYVDDLSRYGALTLKGEMLTAFEEKRGKEEAGWINGGIYLMRRALLLRDAHTPLSLERESFPHLLLSGKRFFAYRSKAKFIDIGTPESYREAQEIVT